MYVDVPVKFRKCLKTVDATHPLNLLGPISERPNF